MPTCSPDDVTVLSPRPLLPRSIRRASPSTWLVAFTSAFATALVCGVVGVALLLALQPAAPHGGDRIVAGTPPMPTVVDVETP